MDDSRLKEKRLFEETIYDGKVVCLRRGEVELPDGAVAIREVVRHVGAVAVLPLDRNGEVICVRQYRYPFDKILLEIPAGKLDSRDEDPREAALRELREETGAVCRELIELGVVYPSVAIFDEKIHLYAAVGLDFGECSPDEDEFLDVVRVPLTELLDMVMRGEIEDAKTQIAVLKAARIAESGKI